MHSKLAAILSAKRDEVSRLRANIPAGAPEDLPPLRDFRAALSAPDKIGLIAEIKFASPSAGLIKEKTDPANIGRVYEKAGAAAVSLITDKPFFGGDLTQLPHLKKAISLPILRKDFIIDEVQVRQSLYQGADAVLLIARVLPQQQLHELIAICRDFGLAALTEIHDRQDLEKALACGAGIIGINNRDLDSFKVDIRTTFELAPLVPDNCVLVSESGIRDADDIVSLKATRIQAVLVGSALMSSSDPAAKTAEIVNAGEMRNE
jgi:indole-3-glycerol phosphate synthase